MFNRIHWLFGLSLLFHVVYGLATELNDPTKPPTLKLKESVQYPIRGPSNLTSIIISKIGRRAIINGEIVKPGDTVEGQTVTRIHRGWVELSQNGIRRKLLLLPSGFKKTVHKKVH